MPLTGDISGSYGKTSIIGITGSLDLTYDGVGTEDGWLQLQEMSSNPTTPASNKGKIFVKDNGSGTTLPYFIDAAGTVTSLLGGGSSSPAGSDSQVQYNNGGSFGGASSLAYDDTNGRLGIGTTAPGQVLSVYGNVSGDYVTTIDNDQSSAGHVLKLLTDGNGSGSRILEMEDGDGDILFRARADGRFGFGPDGVSSMGAGTFVVGIDNSSHTADIAISQRLQHLGDSNTYMDFPSNDNITFAAGGSEELKIASDAVLVKQYIQHIGDSDTYIEFGDDELVLAAGGRSFLKLEEDSTDKLIVNHGGLDIDLKVSGENNANLIRTDAANDSIYFGANSSSGTDNNFWVSGSIESQGTGTRGTAVFGGDLVLSGTTYAQNNLVVEDIDADDEGTITLGDSSGAAYSTLTTNQYGRLTVQTRNNGRDGEIWLDSSDDIVLDAGGTVDIRSSGTSILKITPNSSDVVIQPQVSGKDIILSSQSGNTIMTVDSSDESLIINRRLGLGSAMISSTGTLSADAPFVMIANGGGSDITGTLAAAAFSGQIKVVVGMQMSSGACILSYTNAGGSTTTKTLSNGVAVMLCSFDATGSGAYRWFPVGDVS